ncbi:YlbE-like family protein [Bacillus salitolerans]|uniref:YlbE-like family protein n=1 Tax=Bacillus salitolerans TaxID=1437434 RepID=A0ABW4LKP6_9BACI
MRQDIRSYIKNDTELTKYIREQPYWYRRLSRDPDQLNTFVLSSREHYRKTIPHKVQQFSEQLQMASMMINMFQVMREND